MRVQAWALSQKEGVRRRRCWRNLKRDAALKDGNVVRLLDQWVKWENGSWRVDVVCGDSRSALDREVALVSMKKRATANAYDVMGGKGFVFVEPRGR